MKYRWKSWVMVPCLAAASRDWKQFTRYRISSIKTKAIVCFAVCATKTYQECIWLQLSPHPPSHPSVVEETKVYFTLSRSGLKIKWQLKTDQEYWILRFKTPFDLLWTLEIRILSNIYNMSGRVVSDIQTRAENKWLVKLSSIMDLLAKWFWKYILYNTRKSKL